MLVVNWLCWVRQTKAKVSIMHNKTVIVCVCVHYMLHAKIINIIMIQSQWNVCCVIVSGALHNQLRMVALADCSKVVPASTNQSLGIFDVN